MIFLDETSCKLVHVNILEEPQPPSKNTITFVFTSNFARFFTMSGSVYYITEYNSLPDHNS